MGSEVETIPDQPHVTSVDCAPPSRRVNVSLRPSGCPGQVHYNRRLELQAGCLYVCVGSKNTTIAVFAGFCVLNRDLGLPYNLSPITAVSFVPTAASTKPSGFNAWSTCTWHRTLGAKCLSARIYSTWTASLVTPPDSSAERRT